MTGTLNSIEIGLAAQEEACQFLLNQGLKLISSNYRCNLGEIDLIMQDKEDLVFIEVRLRNNPHFGTAIESVNSLKQKKLIKTARFYLYQKNLYDKVNCRFDIIGLCYAQPKAKLEWIQDAFPADYY